MLGWCFLWDTPIYPGIALPPVTILSPTGRYWCYPPPPLQFSHPSFPRHLHHHHSLAHIFFFSSQYMPIPLKPTFMHFHGYFSHPCCPSNSFIPNSVQLGDSTHPSQHPHFRHIQHLLLCFLHCQCLGIVHHCWSKYHLNLKLILQHTESPIPSSSFPPWLYSMRHLCIQWPVAWHAPNLGSTSH